VRINLDDRPGDFEARYVGGAGRRWVIPLPLEDIRPVDTGRFDADQDFSSRGTRHRPLNRLEHLRTTRRDDFNRNHPIGQHDIRLSRESSFVWTSRNLLNFAAGRVRAASQARLDAGV
jgi:hypothetical protein